MASELQGDVAITGMTGWLARTIHVLTLLAFAGGPAPAIAAAYTPPAANGAQQMPCHEQPAHHCDEAPALSCCCDPQPGQPAGSLPETVRVQSGTPDASAPVGAAPARSFGSTDSRLIGMAPRFGAHTVDLSILLSTFLI